MYPGTIDQIRDFRVFPIAGDEIVNQMEQQLPPDSLCGGRERGCFRSEAIRKTMPGGQIPQQGPECMIYWTKTSP